MSTCKVCILFVLIICFSSSGCALLIIPGAALVGHTVQKNNEEYDDIIVNFGAKYKKYYKEITESNEQKEAIGQPLDKILEFNDWLETQEGSEKERKAIERYKRINMSTH